MALSKKTLDEMQAGAAALANHQGRDLPPDFMERLKETAFRHDALRRWERNGVLRIVKRPRPRATNTKFAFETEEHPAVFDWEKVHLVGDLEFVEDPQVIAYGGYPSELLIAQIALALAGNREDRDG